MQTPGDPALVCPVEAPRDVLEAHRSACSFGPGATTEETLGTRPGFSATIPVRHIIVLMKENRSFDHLFGKLHEQGQPGTEGVPQSFTNRGRHDHDVSPHHADTTCIAENADHQWDAMHAMVNGGEMNGFVSSAALSTDTSGDFAMSYYDKSDLPFYTWLASTYSLEDRHFPSMRSGTDPNRDFLLFGTNAGIIQTGSDTPDPATPSIMRALMDKGYTWGAYSDGFVFGNALGWAGDAPGTHSFHAFIEALDEGHLPNVAFVDGVDGEDDDGPTSDLQAGETWLRTIYEHAVKSPQWPRTAILWTYDEGGAFADHVPPPPACAPSSSPSDEAFVELGHRVPLVVISPYAKPHHVSHVVEDHTAITRFIETVFDLPALTARDANSPGLLDMFDFACEPPMLYPPPAPEPGRAGCE